MSLHLKFNLSCDGSLSLPDGSALTPECYAYNLRPRVEAAMVRENEVARGRLAPAAFVTQAPEGTVQYYALRDVQLPKGWVLQDDGRTLCPACSEKMALAKITRLEPPPPDAERAKLLKELDLGGSAGIEFVERTRRALETEPVLDVRTVTLGEEIQIQAWRDGRLSIQSTRNDAVKLELQHMNFKLAEKPPFMDARLVKVVEGLLSTVQVDRGDDVPEGMRLLDDDVKKGLRIDGPGQRAAEKLHAALGKRQANTSDDLLEAIVNQRAEDLVAALKTLPLIARTRVVVRLAARVAYEDAHGTAEPMVLQMLERAENKKTQ